MHLVGKSKVSMKTSVFVALVYWLWAAVSLAQCFVIQDTTNTGPVTLLSSPQDVSDRLKRSPSLTPRLAKLLDIYHHLAQRIDDLHDRPIEDSPQKFSAPGEDDRTRAFDADVDSDLRSPSDYKYGAQWLTDALQKMKDSNIFSMVNESETGDEIGDPSILHFLSRDDKDSSLTLDSKAKRQQGWNFQYGKRSSPDDRIL